MNFAELTLLRAGSLGSVMTSQAVSTYANQVIAFVIPWLILFTLFAQLAVGGFWAMSWMFPPLPTLVPGRGIRISCGLDLIAVLRLACPCPFGEDGDSRMRRRHGIVVHWNASPPVHEAPGREAVS
jgi:hypothetical protein